MTGIDLDRIGWPEQRLGEALEELVRRSRVTRVETESTRPLTSPGRDEVLNRWFSRTAAALGVEVEPLQPQLRGGGRGDCQGGAGNRSGARGRVAAVPGPGVREQPRSPASARSRSHRTVGEHGKRAFDPVRPGGGAGGTLGGQTGRRGRDHRQAADPSLPGPARTKPRRRRCRLSVGW